MESLDSIAHPMIIIRKPELRDSSFYVGFVDKKDVSQLSGSFLPSTKMNGQEELLKYIREIARANPCKKIGINLCTDEYFDDATIRQLPDLLCSILDPHNEMVQFAHRNLLLYNDN